MPGRQTLSGVFPVVQTPYTPAGEIDLDDLDQELEWVLDHGADGLTTGMVSEVLRLTPDERRTLTEPGLRCCNQAGPIRHHQLRCRDAASNDRAHSPCGRMRGDGAYGDPSHLDRTRRR